MKMLGALRCHQRSKGSLEGFKSYGNPATGTAFVMYFQERQLMNEDPPANPDWMTEIPGFLSGKTVKEVEGEDAYIVASSINDDNHTASVIKIDKTEKAGQRPILHMGRSQILPLPILTERLTVI